MGKKKKNGHETTLAKLVLTTAILEMLEAIITIIDLIVRKIE